jgi:oligosaccharide repeat unit polymerase
MYGIEDKLLAIAFSLLILALARISRHLVGTFFVPAGIFTLAWFAFSFIPLTLLFRVPINSLAILYIFAAGLMILLSAAPFDWRLARNANQRKIENTLRFDTPFLRAAVYFSVGAAITLSVVTMLINGFTINQILFDLLQTSGTYAAVRGNDGLEYGLIGVFGILFTYLSPALGGLRNLERSSRWFFMLTMSPSLLTMVIQSSKIVFLVALCFYISGAIVARIFHHQLNLPKIRSAPQLIVGVTLISSLVLISFVSRLGELNPHELEAIIDPLMFSISSYTLGQIYAFADFFSFAIGSASATSFRDEFNSYGAYTFNSIFSVLGVGKDFPPGMYEETGWFEDVFETNIFTFFRGLIYDFGIFGSLLFVFFFGLFAHFITFQLFTKPRPWAAASVFIAILVFILMSYLFSVFVARYVFFTTVTLWLLLNLNSRIQHTK